LGKYIEKVYPEIIDEIPKSIKKNLYSSKIVWPSGKPTGEKSFVSTNKKSDGVVIQDILLIYGSARYLDPNWPYIKHSAWTYEVWPLTGKIKLPFMADESYLWYKSSPDWYTILVSYTAKYCTNCYQNSAEKIYIASSAGYYSATGHHWGDFPPGYFPPEYDAVSDTGWTYYGS